jgi:hypothetical protein
LFKLLFNFTVSKWTRCKEDIKKTTFGAKEEKTTFGSKEGSEKIPKN